MNQTQPANRNKQQQAKHTLMPLGSFKLGDRVTDGDGYNGTIVKVTEWEGSRWYDVRFGNASVAVRYDSDLRLTPKTLT